MHEDPIKMQSHTESRRPLHVVGMSSPKDNARIDPARTRGKIWLRVVVIALLGSGVFGLTVSKKRPNATQRPSPERQRLNALSEQLSSLKQTDFIVFPDGRVWYVRAVRGRNLEVVGWIGDNTRSEDTDSFVLREDHFAIVRHNDPGWPLERDRFLNQ
jgi:hypothetical protein